ncbi:MAG TPA: hypothetical protein VH796_14490 [Nitrososphaeraceae archaeon]
MISYNTNQQIGTAIAIERFSAKQMNATTISLPSSHLSVLSHPKEVAQLILNATKG